VIGEARKILPAAIKNQHPEIPWEDIAGMRDKLVLGNKSFKFYIYHLIELWGERNYIMFHLRKGNVKN
jgi:uncharacterized protein with HEPN domain